MNKAQDVVKVGGKVYTAYKEPNADNIVRAVKSLSGLVKKKKKKARSGVRRDQTFGNGGATAIPSAMSWQFRTPAPKTIKTTRGTRYIHAEYFHPVRSLTGGGTKIESFDFTPLNTLLPFLSSKAIAYQKYRVFGCKLVYEPVCSTATSGAVYLGGRQDPNTGTNAPSSARDLMNLPGSIVLPPYSTGATELLMEKSREFFVSGDITSSSDLRLQIPNRFFICSESAGVSQTHFGNVFVSYDVELMDAVPEVVDLFALELDFVAASTASVAAFLQGMVNANNRQRAFRLIPDPTVPTRLKIECQADSAFELTFAGALTVDEALISVIGVTMFTEDGTPIVPIPTLPTISLPSADLGYANYNHALLRASFALPYKSYIQIDLAPGAPSTFTGTWNLERIGSN